MSHIENLQIREIVNDILLIHQIKTPYYFSCCDGLLILPKEGRNSNAIALDLNIEPKYIQAINSRFGPVLEYACTHSHMDHIAHVHEWERLGATIWAPHPESGCLLDLYNFYENFGFNETMDYSVVEQFGKLNGYQSCSKVNIFKPGNALKFESLELKTIPLIGHSKAHVGFLLSADKIFHISCLGFDQPKPGVDGFGPWYGFKECNLSQYSNDIDMAEELFLKHAEFLTSSHAYISKCPDTSPFDYMRDKIKKNQLKVDQAIEKLELIPASEDLIVKELLKMDIFFPKSKMKNFLSEIYALWEAWIIRKHLALNKKINYNNKVDV